MTFFKRNTQGKFAKQPKPLSKRGKKFLLGFIALCFLTIASHATFQAIKPTTLVYRAVGHAEAAEIIVTSDTAATIDEMKADVLDQLKKCENPNVTNVPFIFDTNGIASVGSFQWQPHSFAYYWEKMTGDKITKKDAVLYALDEDKARELTEWVIFETDAGAGKDWVICERRHDLDTLVRFIKAHE